MSQVTGIVKIYVNGSLQRSKEGASLKTGGAAREAVVGHSVYGYTETVEASELDCTLAHTSDLDVEDLNDFTDATLTFVTDTGVTYLVNNAFTSESCTVNAGGDVSLRMMGDPAVREE